MRTRQRSSTTVLFLFALLLTALVMAPAHAQFQRTYGGSGNEAGRGGVQQTFDGGFIATGESDSDVPDYDIFVVKTNSVGNKMWSYKYDIGANDFAQHIQQTSDTGYIVTGYTRDTANCCAQDNLFLLKLDRNGGVQWVKTYGGTDDEQGWCVREVRGGGYIVAGRSGSFGQGNYDGYLLRTGITGALLWSRVYGGTNIDYFLSCVQDSITTDIYAVGATSSFGNGQQGLAVRVDLSSGVPVWNYVYGVSGSEVFRSIRRLPGTLTDFIIAGLSTSLTPSSSGLLVQLNPQGAVVKSMFYNPGGLGNWDEFADAVEINSGTVGVVGLVTNAPGGFGSFDMVVLEVNLWNMGVSRNWVFGGTASDQGVSIGKVGVFGPKLIAAGLTNSFGKAQQLFLVETSGILPSDCEGELTYDTLNPRFDSLAIELPTSRVLMSCISSARTRLDTNKADTVCSDGSGGRIAPPSDQGMIDSIPDSGQIDLSSVDDQASSRLDAVTIASFPNPVRNGETFTISYHATQRSRATVEIVSMAGKVVRTLEQELLAGENQVSVSTEGWGVGSYIVRVAVAGRTDSRRIVVSER